MRLKKPSNIFLILAAIVVTMLMFLFEISNPLGYIDWVFYLIPIFIVALSNSLIATCSLLVLIAGSIIVGFEISPIQMSHESIQQTEIVNRSAGYVVLLLFALVIHLYRRLSQSKTILGRLNKELSCANKELESFSYSAAHDLRNPLNSIASCVAVLSRTKKGMDGDALKAIDYIKQTTGRMSQIINDLLALSHISRTDLRPAPVLLSTIALDFMNALRASNPRNVAEVIIMPELTASADEGLARILLENLLGNAWKFSSKNDLPRIEFGMMQTGGKSVFFVRDNGVGFDMSTAKQMFEPFKRLHSQKEFPGSGVGLAIVNRIVERHGGAIWAESEPGKGATFYFTLQFQN